ncbi:hypothetical protein [Streptomyces sp. NBC_01465]|uniref:hypothetical protein n=1 Tax=Streptomyces sp. NBC_01465 TaxID=2903878 RepID=UPI002E37099F|nr:hypothetical protein [Streptomyces sp. NBC_01465]
MPKIHLSRSVLTCAVAVSTAAVLTGCSGNESPPALKFGTAKASGARLDDQPPQGSSLPVAQWPDACKVLGDEEVRAILPQAEDFAREPIKVTIINFNPLQDADPGTTGDVPKGGCETKFGLPAKYDSEHNSSIKIVFKTIADPALVTKAYTEDRDDEAKDAGKGTDAFRDLGNSLGAPGCYTQDRTHELVCHQGPYEFEVSGLSTADGVGKYPQAEKNWRDKVLTEVVRTLSARMAGQS